jgi:hypothetical protein
MPTSQQIVRRAALRPPTKIQAEEAFAELKAAGLIDPKWESIANLNAAYIQAVKEVEADAVKAGKDLTQAKINAKARAMVGVLPPIFTKRGINNRALRDIFPPKLQQAIDNIAGPDTVKKALAQQRKDWENTQILLREVGNKIGMKLNIGHFLPHAFGAPQDISAAGAEGAKANQLAKDTPRTVDIQGLRMNQVSINKTEGIYETILRADGLTKPMHPLVSVLFGTDETSRFVSLDQAEMLSRRFEEIEGQGGDVFKTYNNIRETGNTDVESMFRAGFEDDIKKGTFPPAKPKAKTPKSGEILDVIKGSRLARTVGRALPIGAASLILSQQEVSARELEYKNNPSPINKFQLDLAKFALAADIAGTTPAAPVAEPASMAAAVGGMLIDERETVAEIGGRAAKAVKEYDTIVNAPQRAISSAVGGGARYLAGLMMPETKPQAKPKPTQTQPTKKGKLKIGGMELPEFGISEFLGFN